MIGSSAELSAIMRALEAATNAWVAAGYGYDTPEWEAREAAFRRLNEWHQARRRL